MVQRYNLFSRIQTKLARNKHFQTKISVVSTHFQTKNSQISMHFQTKNTKSRSISKVQTIFFFCTFITLFILMTQEKMEKLLILTKI